IGQGNSSKYEDYFNIWKKYKKSIHYNEINYNFLTRFKNKKLQTATPSGVNVCISVLRAVYNEAVKRGIYTPETHVNPFAGIMEKTPPTKDKYLSIEEMRKMFENPSENRF